MYVSKLNLYVRQLLTVVMILKYSLKHYNIVFVTPSENCCVLVQTPLLHFLKQCWKFSSWYVVYMYTTFVLWTVQNVFNGSFLPLDPYETLRSLGSPLLSFVRYSFGFVHWLLFPSFLEIINFQKLFRVIQTF